jgi:hypothetical protein
MLKRVIPLIVIFALAFTVAVFTFLQKDKPAENNPSQSLDLTQANFLAQLETANNLRCTWKQDELNFIELSVSKKRLYAKGILDDYEVFLILKENCIWSWNNEDLEGSKKCFDDANSAASSAGMDNISAKSYQCQEGIVSESLFTLPPQVVFKE